MQRYGFSPGCILWWFIKYTFHLKSLLTLSALLLFLLHMCSLIEIRLLFWEKVFFTFAAKVWFLPSVYSLLIYKITFHWEMLVTLATLIWFLISVCYLVFYKITIMWKCLSHWLHWNNLYHACVNSLVKYNTPILIESLLALDVLI